MERQNITLALPKDVIRRVKSLAASEDKSISQLLRETLEKKLKDASSFQSARRRQITLLKSGFNLGTKGKITVTRETLHDRR
ncbi:MAG: DUF6364 family protein [Smithella sp.]|jgi:predicted DNA-binding protein